MIPQVKQSIKTSIALALIAGSTLIIYNNSNMQRQVAVVTKDKSQIKYALGSKVVEDSRNDGEDTYEEKELTSENENLLKFNETMDLKLEDKASPNNIDGVNTRILEDNMIISFNKPEDKGTNYEYTINNNGKEKKIGFYAKSDIKGYSYIIDNNLSTESNTEKNKLDDSPILLQNLDWGKDYYLHFRSFDGNDNYSENKTFKLDLPSDGIGIKYIDINSNEEIEKEQNISGIANATYDVTDSKKEIEGYELLNVEGELNGVLKKDKINIIYEYAKKSSIIVNYIEKESGNIIKNSKTILGHEGEKVKIDIDDVYGYTHEENTITATIKGNETEINAYYNAIPKGTVNIKHIDQETGLELLETQPITDYINETYYSDVEEIEGYELKQEPDEANGVISEGTKDVVYYYKRKGIEKMDDKYNNEETIIDELINSLDEELIEDEGKKEKEKADNEANSNSKRIIPGVKAEYEIVMNCDNSDYFIYYKK